jgi:hypothetical protein
MQGNPFRRATYIRLNSTCQTTGTWRVVMITKSTEVELLVYYAIAHRSTLQYATRLAGQPIEVEILDHRVVLRLPKLEESTGPQEFRVSARTGEAPDFVAFGARVIEARVGFTGDVNVFPGTREPPVPTPHFQSRLDAAELAARSAVARFRSWARLGQPWIGLSDELLPWIEPLRVRDTSTGETINCRPRDSVAATTIIDGPHLTQEVVALIEEPQAAPAIADEFLSDARFLSHWSLAPAYSHAVLAAAAACELKVKAALRQSVQGKGTADLLDIILSNPRSFPQAAHELFDSVSRVILGFSLREHDKALFQELRTLFERRNAIAHRGITIGGEESGDLVRTAIAIIGWIDDVSASPRPASKSPAPSSGEVAF